MKNFLFVSTLICLGMVGFSSTALAGKPTETVIAHCGCNYLGDALEWQIITVNPNGKGHLQHNPGPEECLDENDENPVTLDRYFNDCTIVGVLNTAGLQLCSTYATQPVQDGPCGDAL